MYNIFCYLNYPLWKIILLLRKFKGKEHNNRYIEKLGYSYLKRPKGEVIWVHALGLGETLSLTLFLQILSQRYKSKTILFTSSTLHSFIAFKKVALSKNVIHQFAPIDNVFTVRRFLNHWKPSICLISELDLWPIRIIEAQKYGLRMLLFNTRMNKKKRNDRLIFSSILRKTLASFDAIFLQDEDSRIHFQFFGVPLNKLSVCGPLKVAGSVMAKDFQLIDKLRSWSNGKLVWIAASIHEDEELEILKAFNDARLAIPSLILILAPRSLDLIKTTEKRCKSYPFKFFTRNLKDQFPEKDTDILLVATVGEMGSFYNQSDVAFIGNSLDFERIKTGKNPFEAIQEKCVVIHGPKMLEPSYSIISERGISEIVFNKDDISRALLKYSSEKEREIKIKRGLNFINSNSDLIKNFLRDMSLEQKKGTR